jgi:insulysin
MNKTRVLPPLTKSPLDGREYRGLQLANNMQVLLISDKQTDISAAALSVAAGE